MLLAVNFFGQYQVFLKPSILLFLLMLPEPNSYK